MSAISVVPGFDKPRAAKFVRELVEQSFRDLLKPDYELGGKNNPVSPTNIGARVAKHFPDVVKKNYKRLISVTNVCN